LPKEKKVEKQLPLTESTFYILAALVEPKHGYAVMQEVEGASEGLVALGPGTLYGALTNFENSKLIRKMGEEDRRKIYSITEFG
jgi:DNA-binding PadR family transcriptional regulator